MVMYKDSDQILFFLRQWEKVVVWRVGVCS